MKIEDQPLISMYEANSAINSRPAFHRTLFSLLVATTTIGLTVWMALLVSGNRLLALDCIVVLGFGIKALWVVLVFWSSAIGFVLRRTRSRILDLPSPAGAADLPARSAIVMATRNDNPTSVIARLQAIKHSLEETGLGDRFDYFLLSDSADKETAAVEEREFLAWREKSGSKSRLTFRWREINDDFKAGNLRDFCQRWGRDYELMVVLDADSIMAGSTIVQLIRIMQSNPRLGILQSMIDCILPGSAFARIFEFDHRSVWHNYILGSVWWQGERGQYRGHNAVVRIGAYMAHCRLSDTLGTDEARKHMMCYDQVEAALMHRAGYEVREVPVSSGSYEGLPPALPDYLIRYRRWAEGNLTNLRLLRLAGLSTMDRYQLVAVAHRFLAWPAFVIFIAAATLTAASWPAETAFPVGAAALLYATFIALYFAPRIFGLIDAIEIGVGGRGDIPRLFAASVAASLFMLLFVPIAMVSVTLYFIGRLLGRRMEWASQQRDIYALSWCRAAAALWPTSAFAVAALALLSSVAPAALLWFLPFLVGPLVAIPFAVASSSPWLGDRLRKANLFTMPEELAPPEEIEWVRRSSEEPLAP